MRKLNKPSSDKMPLEIMIDLVKMNVMKATDVRDRMATVWMNNSIVCALILSMIRFTHNWGCQKERQVIPIESHFCVTIHPMLSIIALALNLMGTTVYALICTYAQVVPETHLVAFFERFGYLSAHAFKAAFGGLACWVVDTAWAGCTVYGMHIVSYATSALLLGAFGYICVEGHRMQTFLAKEMRAEEEEAAATNRS
mmetsp:Transcript_133599/g.415467  ORF Transcript_133599/g.415467 Transcript_133599/m.415467 type:complete len:198 (+) Transcript_133599:72-665(+)